jgi:hypothetical protein
VLLRYWSRHGDVEARLETAGGLQFLGDLRDVTTAGAHRHAEPAGHHLVLVPLGHQPDDRLFEVVGGGRGLLRVDGERRRALPQMVEHRAQEGHQGRLAHDRRPRRPAGSGALGQEDRLPVVDDQPVDEFVGGTDLRALGGDIAYVRAGCQVAAGGVLVDRADAYAAGERAQRGLAGRGELLGRAGAAGLNGVHLLGAVLGEVVQHRLDPGDVADDVEGLQAVAQPAPLEVQGRQGEQLAAHVGDRLLEVADLALGRAHEVGGGDIRPYRNQRLGAARHGL